MIILYIWISVLLKFNNSISFSSIFNLVSNYLSFPSLSLWFCSRSFFLHFKFSVVPLYCVVVDHLATWLKFHSLGGFLYLVVSIRQLFVLIIYFYLSTIFTILSPFGLVLLCLARHSYFVRVIFIVTISWWPGYPFLGICGYKCYKLLFLTGGLSPVFRRNSVEFLANFWKLKFSLETRFTSGF